MNRSEAINELATALGKAQAAIKGAVRGSTNPFLKTTYADLTAVWDACRAQLTGNGLSVSQGLRSIEAGVEVETMLMHSSGQWISETLALPVSKHDAQGFGSAITYARRYSLAALVGVPNMEEDDGGNAAVVAKPAAEDFKPTRGVKVTPTAGIENSMPLAQQAKVREFAEHVTDTYQKGDAELTYLAYKDGKAALEGDADAQAFLWKSIDPKARKQIQQFGMSQKTAQQA